MKFGYEWVRSEEAEGHAKWLRAPKPFGLYDDTKPTKPEKPEVKLASQNEWLEFLEQHPDCLEKYNFKWHELDDVLGTKACAFLAWFSKFIPSTVYIEALSKASDLDMIATLVCMSEIRQSAKKD